MNGNKVVLGLSGGVDSAVTALRLKDAGYEVHALYLDIGLGGEQSARVPTPGQLAVFYGGEIVLGSGWIQWK